MGCTHSNDGFGTTAKARGSHAPESELQLRFEERRRREHVAGTRRAAVEGHRPSTINDAPLISFTGAEELKEDDDDVEAPALGNASKSFVGPPLATSVDGGAADDEPARSNPPLRRQHTVGGPLRRTPSAVDHAAFQRGAELRTRVASIHRAPKAASGSMSGSMHSPVIPVMNRSGGWQSLTRRASSRRELLECQRQQCPAPGHGGDSDEEDYVVDPLGETGGHAGRPRAQVDHAPPPSAGSPRRHSHGAKQRRYKPAVRALGPVPAWSSAEEEFQPSSFGPSSATASS